MGWNYYYESRKARLPAGCLTHGRRVSGSSIRSIRGNGSPSALTGVMIAPRHSCMRCPKNGNFQPPRAIKRGVISHCLPPKYPIRALHLRMFFSRVAPISTISAIMSHCLLTIDLIWGVRTVGRKEKKGLPMT